jgi:4'-phosphopantetheinyl transferase
MPASARSPAPHEVHAWYASTSGLGDARRIERAVSWLIPSERDRYGRFRRDEDRHMFLLGRVMARLVVGRAAGVAPTAWQWREGARGRPEIASPATPLRFNIAHSAGLVVCALSMGREVGIDVEGLTRPPLDPALIPRYCAPEEAADIEAQPDGLWQRRFLTYWTLKEAYLKARGLGIALPLTDIAFSLGSDSARVVFRESLAGTDDRWTFCLSQPTGDHLMAIAASSSDGVHPVFTIEPFALELVDSDGTLP